MAQSVEPIELEAYRRRARGVSALQVPPPLSWGGSDGTSGGMEGRVAKLEAQAEYANKRLDRVEAKLDGVVEKLATLEERIAHLPTKELLVKASLGTIAAILAVTSFVTVFQAKLQALFGLAPPTP